MSLMQRTMLIACVLFSLLDPALFGASPHGGQGTGGLDLAPLRTALERTGIDQAKRASILASIEASPEAFSKGLAAVQADRKRDPMLLYKVDKAKALPDSYVPPDLLLLDARPLSLSRQGHKLRREAESALEAMDRAARKEGVTLLVSSAYRSYSYQAGLFERNVKELGQAKAELESARPGHSQHQLGTAIDFGSITDDFAETRASRWLTANARSFGFSLSFPKGMTEVTGYRWESWHYRYIGKAAAKMEAEYFDGVQEYLLLFLDALEP
jgi:zinc D-Ala-D-Ala carboxypeptidase